MSENRKTGGEETARIKKRSGELQEFDRRKLEESMKRAGASEETARRVADRIEPSEGMTTDELRKHVSRELERENALLSGAYASTRRLRARTASDLAAGVALFHEEVLRQHGLQSGQPAHVVHMDRRADVQVRPTESAKLAEIWMSKSDLERLGASEGSRVNVRFRA